MICLRFCFQAPRRPGRNALVSAFPFEADRLPVAVRRAAFAEDNKSGSAREPRGGEFVDPDRVGPSAQTGRVDRDDPEPLRRIRRGCWRAPTTSNATEVTY